MIRILIGLLAAIALLFTGQVAAGAAVKEPPRSAVGWQGLVGTCSPNRDGTYYTLATSPQINWVKHPRKKGPTTTGHYLRVKTEIQAQAGYGGTLWKTLAKKSAKTKTYHLNQRPRGLVLPVSTNLRQGLSSYRVKVTVRVIRDVRLALDTTAWKMTLHSAAFLCWSPGVA